MKQKRHTTDQIIGKLRQADQELGKGKKVPDICRILEINVQTYYRWRQKYGGMEPSMAKELRMSAEKNSPLGNRVPHPESASRFRHPDPNFWRDVLARTGVSV